MTKAQKSSRKAMDSRNKSRKKTASYILVIGADGAMEADPKNRKAFRQELAKMYRSTK